MIYSCCAKLSHNPVDGNRNARRSRYSTPLFVSFEYWPPKDALFVRSIQQPCLGRCRRTKNCGRRRRTNRLYGYSLGVICRAGRHGRDTGTNRIDGPSSAMDAAGDGRRNQWTVGTNQNEGVVAGVGFWQWSDSVMIRELYTHGVFKVFVRMNSTSTGVETHMI